MCSINLDKKLVVNRFDELVTKYCVAHAQQENVQKLAEPAPRTDRKRRCNKMSKKDECEGGWICYRVIMTTTAQQKFWHTVFPLLNAAAFI